MILHTYYPMIEPGSLSKYAGRVPIPETRGIFRRLLDKLSPKVREAEHWVRFRHSPSVYRTSVAKAHPSAHLNEMQQMGREATRAIKGSGKATPKQQALARYWSKPNVAKELDVAEGELLRSFRQKSPIAFRRRMGKELVG